MCPLFSNNIMTCVLYSTHGMLFNFHMKDIDSVMTEQEKEDENFKSIFRVINF